MPEPQTGSFGIPTLVDVPIPAPEYNEDMAIFSTLEQ